MTLQAVLATDWCMRSSSNPSRYVLVPRSPQPDPRSGKGDPPAGPAPRPVRRYSLARLSVSPRSALGEDRHARLEHVARQDRERP